MATTYDGINYFPIAVNFMEENAMEVIEAKYGMKGLAIVLKLLCKIYKEGYYMLYHINEGIFNKCVSFINSISDTENILNDITVSTIGCSDNCKSAQMCCKRKGLL